MHGGILLLGLAWPNAITTGLFASNGKPGWNPLPYAPEAQIMNTIRRLIYGEVLSSIALVALGFLALFFFFDLVDELQYLGKNIIGEGTYCQIKHALLYVTLLIPNHLYELLPISVLIGSIFVMARLAQSSEYTILRTSGLGPWRALKLLLGLGLLWCSVS